MIYDDVLFALTPYWFVFGVFFDIMSQSYHLDAD